MSVKRLDQNDSKDIPEPVQEKIVYTNEEITFSILAYCNILFLLPLFLKQDSEFCQFHARQGVILFFVFVIIAILSFSASFVLSVFGTIVKILGIIFMAVFMGIGIYNVIKREQKALPVFDKYIKL